MARFCILGPFEIRRDSGTVVTLDGDRPRTLLALMLLHRNGVVSVSQLVDSIWGARAPSSARKNVQTHVWRIRRCLEDIGSGQLERRGATYVLRVPRGELDLDEFNDFTAEGQQLLAAGPADMAAKAFQSALDVWRGQPLSDVAFAEPPQGELVMLAERRMAALEGRIEADMRCKRWSVVIPELRKLTLENPYREELWTRLMIALDHSGRRIEALEVYSKIRGILQREFGMEPGPALQLAYSRLLGTTSANAR
ncbi:MAG TPA: AfsR/SARP family transcriptional regulator [Trebonia sp.]|jgi:DNA-binding SARP family transcriptional activator|nr:AfsR/SARP family transcriptional regulator [Trebonia sp.]